MLGGPFFSLHPLNLETFRFFLGCSRISKASKIPLPEFAMSQFLSQSDLQTIFVKYRYLKVETSQLFFLASKVQTKSVLDFSLSRLYILGWSTRSVNIKRQSKIGHLHYYFILQAGLSCCLAFADHTLLFHHVKSSRWLFITLLQLGCP